MFNKLAIRILLKENARLRRELRRKERRELELIDKFVHHRVPERLRTYQAPTAQVPFEDYVMPDAPSDAYSMAIADAERRAATEVPFDQLIEQEEEATEDDD